VAHTFKLIEASKIEAYETTIHDSRMIELAVRLTSAKHILSRASATYAATEILEI
jgi:hypothetical protein